MIQNMMIEKTVRQIMQEDFRTVIGRFSGRTNVMEIGMMSLNTCCSTLAQADTPYSVHPVLWNEEI